MKRVVFILALCFAVAAVQPAVPAQAEIEIPLTRLEAVGQVEPVAFEAVGDSMTALEYMGEPRGDLSWVNWAVTERVIYFGGCAESGFQAWQMAACYTHNPAAGVLVLMAGTNDIRNGVDPAISLLYFDAITTASTLPASRIIISAVPPTDHHPSQAVAFNAVLYGYAMARGFVFVDPWVPWRAGSGAWVTGASYDQLHPVGAVQERVGAHLRAYVIAANDKFVPPAPESEGHTTFTRHRDVSKMGRNFY